MCSMAPFSSGHAHSIDQMCCLLEDTLTPPSNWRLLHTSEKTTVLLHSYPELARSERNIASTKCATAARNTDTIAQHAHHKW